MENNIDNGITGEDNIDQEETLGDNEKTGEKTGEDNVESGITNETTSNTESLTDPSNQNNDTSTSNGTTGEDISNNESLTEPSTSNETSTYTPDEIIEMTKQTSDQADTSSDQTETSSPIIYIPKTLILGQDGSCDYIV